MRSIAITICALVAFVLIATSSFEAPACAKRMAANSIAGFCVGN